MVPNLTSDSLKDFRQLTGEKSVPVVFLDIDTQKDFILPEGRLSIPGAETIVNNLARLSDYGARNGVLWISTMDSHNIEDPEISSEPDFVTTFPPHCMDRTPGEERIAETLKLNPFIVNFQKEPFNKLQSFFTADYDSIVFKKNNVDIFSNQNFERFLAEIHTRTLVVFGVATDFCVKFAVQGLIDRDYRVVVVTDAVYAINQESGEKLLSEWKEQGAKLLKTEQVVSQAPDNLSRLFLS